MASYPFNYTAHNVLLTPLPFHLYFSPLPQFYYFPSSIFSSFIPSSTFLLFSPSFLNILLFLNFGLYPPPPLSWLPSSTIFIIFPFQSWFSFSSTSSFILYIFPSLNTSTSYRPYIYPRLNFLSTLLRE